MALACWTQWTDGRGPSEGTKLANIVLIQRVGMEVRVSMGGCWVEMGLL